MRIPQNINPYVYADDIIKSFCHNYDFEGKAKTILKDSIYGLYEEHGVFCDQWEEIAPNRSKNITFSLVYKKIKAKMEDLKAMKVSQTVIDIYENVLDRLDMFIKDYTIEYNIFCQDGDKGEDLSRMVNNNSNVIIEGYGLEESFKSFIFEIITNVINTSCNNDNKTVLVIDGIDSLLKNDTQIARRIEQDTKDGLFIYIITQNISDIPSSVTDKIETILFANVIRDDNDVLFYRARSNDFESRNKLLRIMQHMPIGWFIVTDKDFKYKLISINKEKEEDLENIPFIEISAEISGKKLDKFLSKIKKAWFLINI